MATSNQKELTKELLAMAMRSGPGKQIPPQDQLAKEFDVSRTMVREAMAILEHIKVIVVKPKIGCTVNEDVEAWGDVDADLMDMINQKRRDLAILGWPIGKRKFVEAD